MNYEQMSDHDINVAVRLAKFGEPISDFDRFYDSFPVPNYCNDPSLSWPIIVTNGISLSAWQNGKDWTAWFAGNSMEHCAPEFSHASDTPLRSAMIVYLMMQESA